MKLYILLMFSLLSSGSIFASELTTDDKALIQHLKRTDYVLSTALKNCKDENVKRINDKEFIFSAVCDAKLADESDCPNYQVYASGTVDSKSWATIRDINLKLLCYG